jgi:tRNA(Ile2) C34 agmatinyltransferase TiaS
MSAFGMRRKGLCPDCGGGMKGGECEECGYGNEEEDDDEEEPSNVSALLEIRDDLQRLSNKIAELIKNGD